MQRGGQRSRQWSQPGGGGRFGEIGDGEPAKEIENRFVDSAEGFANRAVIGLVADAVFGKAVGQDDGAVDGADDFEGGNALGIAGEAVASVGAGHGAENFRFGELLQYFSEQRDGEVISVRDVFRAGRGTGGGEVAQGDETVVRFFGELQQFESGPL